MTSDQDSSRTGIPVDATGGPTIDPTKNVLDLVHAAVKRLDDLHENDTVWSEKLRNSETLRQDQHIEWLRESAMQLRAAESHRVDEVLKLHSEFTSRLSDAERDRINAIRAVDVGAVAVAAQRSSDQANVLANQVAASAETLRSLVATTATTAANTAAQIAAQFTDRLASTEKALTDRIGALEKAQYENKGRSGVSDPLMEDLARQMRQLASGQQNAAGKSEGIGASWSVLIAVVAALIALGGLFIKLQSTPTPLAQTTPQVIVTPSPIQIPAK